MNTTKKIGMVGIGMMGHGIATNLVKHGHRLQVLEHEGNQPLDALVAAGVRTASSLSELTPDNDIILLCVTGSPQVESVLLGPQGILATLRPGTIVIDCSTALPSSTQKIAKQVIDAGGQFLDAPMTRTPKEAAQGRLNLLVGGSLEVFEQCRPVLACFAENITHAGAIGDGHRMKLLHNYVSLGFVALLSEAAACAQRSGIDFSVLVEVLSKGGGGGAALDRVSPYLLRGDRSALQFFMSNARKDLDYYCTMAAQADALHDISDSILKTYDWGTKMSGNQAGVLELVDLLSKTKS